MRLAKPTYANPVHRGDYPDPSIVRVGKNDFWATVTSTEWAPHFPLLHSKDLIHWEQVDAVFTERPNWSRGKFWAPEISMHDGRFYVYYVAEHTDGPLTVAVATADRPEGPYTDHGPLVGQASGSIDPTTIAGEDGRVYLLWKEDGNSRGLPTTIWIQPLSDDGLSLTGEAVAILQNDCAWEGDVVEGPSVIRRGGWFYLFYSGNACCGADCKYAVGVARARSVLGPWEKYGQNPVIDSNAQWRCPGHGSVVDTADGRTFYLYHAYSRSGSIYVGRQVLLDAIEWSGDWPVVNGGNGPSSVAAAPFRRAQRRASGKSVWQWPHTTRPRVVRHPLRRGMFISDSAEASTGDILGCVLARPILETEYHAETGISIRSLKPGVQAGLTAFGDIDNAVGVGIRDGIVVVWRRSRGRHREVSTVPVKRCTTVRFRMHVTNGYEYRFSYSLDGRRWHDIEPVVRAPHLTPWDRGIRVALTVGGVANAKARFKWFAMRSSRPDGSLLRRIASL